MTASTSSIRRKDNSGNNTYGTNGNGWDSNNNSSDFYLETDIIINPPLPVELSYFTIKILHTGGIKLNWRTETELSNYGFEIERSEINPKSEIRNPQFEKIGFIVGHGNSNSRPKDYSFIDQNVSGGKYSYRLKQIDTDGKFEHSKVIEVEMGSPTKFELSQNYPNPFNPSTTISFSMPQSGNVKLTVYNLLGEQVAELVNGFREAGVHSINFNAEKFNSEVFIYKLEANSFTLARKKTLIK